MSTVFSDRDELRSKLRDLLVSEVRQGLIEGDRAKEIAQDILDELELTDDSDTPLNIFDRIYTRYPQELQALKDRIDAAALTDRDQDVARRMAELIVQGRFDDAIAVSRGQALVELATAASPSAAPLPVEPQDVTEPQAASPTPQAATEPQAASPTPQAATEPQAASPTPQAAAEPRVVSPTLAAFAPTIGQHVAGVAAGAGDSASNAMNAAQSSVESIVRSFVSKAATGATSFVGGFLGKFQKP